jgi:hypothetical protein
MQLHWSACPTGDAVRAPAPALLCTHPTRDSPQLRRELPPLLWEAGSCPGEGGQLLRRRMRADQCGTPIRRPRRRGDQKYREGRGQRRDPAMNLLATRA